MPYSKSSKLVQVSRRLLFSLNDKAIGHHFPQVLNSQFFHLICRLDVIDLTVAAVTGQYKHLSTSQSNLFHLTASMINSLIVIPGGQRAAAAATTDLMQLIRVQIHPIVETLIHDPSGFLEKAMTESFLSTTAVIAWIMVCCFDIEPIVIQNDSLFLDIVNK